MNVHEGAASRRVVCATTAQFPGMGYLQAVSRLVRGVREPVFGRISVQHCQLCPQTGGHLSPDAVEALRESYPTVRFRTHANARVLPKMIFADLSCSVDEMADYFDALADRNHRLGASVLSLHAGYRNDGWTLQQMLDNRARIEERMGLRVCVEGMYPDPRGRYLVSTWACYEKLLRDEVPLAVDVSHLNIVAAAEGTQELGLVRALLESALEVHVSANDGQSDAHAIPADPPWWAPVLERATLRDDCVVFTEGRQR